MHFTGHGAHQPPALILDFLYGVAAYHWWGIGQDIKEVMQDSFMEHFKSIPILPDPPSNNGENSPEPDDNDNHEYMPPQP